MNGLVIDFTLSESSSSFQFHYLMKHPYESVYSWDGQVPLSSIKLSPNYLHFRDCLSYGQFFLTVIECVISDVFKVSEEP